ncbi:MAG: acyl-CoA dehydrogenase family protein [Alphaproteobacteria bacterium]|nr:acyl-CoA dehydrogenase family protein [Alphaproteobacteria bacterium]
MIDKSKLVPVVADPGGPWVLETGTPELLVEIRDAVHRFAADVMRPVGAELDKLTPEEVIAPGSPLYEVHKKYWDLGTEALQELPPEQALLGTCYLAEEIGWGDAGLAISIGLDGMIASLGNQMGMPEIAERYHNKRISAWAVTEPDHGSDMLDSLREVFGAGGSYGRPNCVVRRQGNEIVIRGQKSAWVSNGVVAEQAMLFAAYDNGKDDGLFQGCVVTLPLDVKGVSRGKPLNKMGQRALPQGEIFFDEVRLPAEHLAVEPDRYHEAVSKTLTGANAGMGLIFAGVARAAFEHALEYAHERRQGGVPIIQHQSVRARLFKMWRRVEMARALGRRVFMRNALGPQPVLHAAIAAKVTSTEIAFEVASDAVQMFGGNGVSREYPVEKILRDARASMIEDGCNEFLSIKGGSQLVDFSRF